MVHKAYCTFHELIKFTYVLAKLLKKFLFYFFQMVLSIWILDDFTENFIALGSRIVDLHLST